MSFVGKIGMFQLDGGWHIPNICRESSWLAGWLRQQQQQQQQHHPRSARTQQPSPILLAFRESPTRKEGGNWVEPIVWMLKPTLVNTESPSTRVLESKAHSEMEKSRGKCEDERQRGALVHSLRSQSVVTWPEQRRLKNVRWRRIYIDRSTTLVVTYPAVRSNKIETKIRINL